MNRTKMSVPAPIKIAALAMALAAVFMLGHGLSAATEQQQDRKSVV